MGNQEILIKIKKIIESGNYEIEELLEVVPNDLLPQVLNILKQQIKFESEEIKLDIQEKTR